ncbi:MAG: histidinol dehydrogenase, partial [Sulfurospirillum sp.]
MLLLKTNEPNFKAQFDELLRRGHMDMENVSKIVLNIIAEIKAEGNGALKNHIEKFDKWRVESDEALEVKTSDMKKAYDALDAKLKEALELAYKRIYAYHEKLMPKSWLDFENNGTVLGQKVTPVDRAGLYIPGGKAAYPSSLLMNAIPAIVAGVKEIVVCTPAPNNELNPLLLAAMHLCGIKKAYKVGG